ncbi:protein unc-13 homolog isoform X2 [Tasmannia lanceolata]|uniref:protein unc-13 homolog isoform X2 n=1 Tax=Tasmannia lanceolata TaxID=3420 RepID=UPI0040648B02
MGPHSRRESLAGSSSSFLSRSWDSFESEPLDLDYPFEKINGVDKDDLRETAYEVFFTACRSSPGFGGRNALNYYSAQDSTSGAGEGGGGSPTAAGGGGGGAKYGLSLAASRTKRVLGLKAAKRSSPKRAVSFSNPPVSGNNIPPAGSLRPKRPLTSAELMRHQMRVSEQSDGRLRKTLMRALVGQAGRRADLLILPLELLRHLKPSEFTDTHEYHIWQKRQLKILEAGLLLYPAIPLDRSNSCVFRLREIIRYSESKPIDTNKNSETMQALYTCVLKLAFRTHKPKCPPSPNGDTLDPCHWADGFPFNLHLYLALLQSIFDTRDDETTVLDEVDELLELMKKTWTMLGMTKPIHNVCFTWLLFQQFVITGQVELDLLSASLTMLADVANDAKRGDREFNYVRILSAVLASMQGWAEKKMVDYHDNFDKGVGLMENVLPLALWAAKILEEEGSNGGVVLHDGDCSVVDSAGNRVDNYIRSSLRNAFAKILEGEKYHKRSKEEMEEEYMSEALLLLAKETDELAMRERENFSPVLKRWHPTAAGVAAATLHNCYGVVLKQYLTSASTLTNHLIQVLQTAGKLERVLVQIVVEDAVDCEDGGKAIVREMLPYEVDSVILSLMKTWVDERLKRGKECLNRAKETETWNPRSKAEPYAQSAVDIMKLAKDTVDDFYEVPVGICDDLVQDLADGLETLLQEYISFVAACGSKQSYIPILPPLTRCNQDSRFKKLWKKASPCKIGADNSSRKDLTQDHDPRPSTSRGTQRLYIRLNTLHYILLHLHSLDKSISLSPRPTPSPRSRLPNSRRRLTTTSYFDLARSSIQTATQHVSEVAAFRLIFLDSRSVFYDCLYSDGVSESRIRPAVRILKQNLTLLTAILTDRSQALAIKEIMKASFEAFLMVLLAGGGSRTFSRSDHEMVVEDFGSLKRVFCTCGEGLVAEDVVDRESEVVEGVVALMGQGTDQLLEDFTIVACEASGLGLAGAGQKVPMPPTTGRWNRSDPNTILRVLCHRNDDTANRFLKRTFQLATRR